MPGLRRGICLLGGRRWLLGLRLDRASVDASLCGAQSPPSARWLALRGKNVEAVRAWRSYALNDVDAPRRRRAGARRGLRNRAATACRRGSGTGAYRRALTAGIGVVLLQQFTGQPSVLYYAGAPIFDAAGRAPVASVAVGVFKLVATLGAVATVDRHGRRKLLFIGIGLGRRASWIGDCVSRLRGEGGGFTTRKCASSASSSSAQAYQIPRTHRVAVDQ